MLRSLISASLVAALMAGTASADTLREALVSAYQTNPTLTGAARDAQGHRRQCCDRQGRGPAASQRDGRAQPDAHPKRRSHQQRQGSDLSGGVDLSYPFFNGGSVRNSVRAAQTRVEAGRATLRAVEGDVFTQAIDRLHGRDPRPRDRRAQPEQRQGAGDQPAGDAGPVPDRRSYPHRRRPVRIAASARPRAARDRAGTARRRAKRLIGS